MRLYTFEQEGKTRVGVSGAAPDYLIDVGAADPSIPSDMLALIAAGQPAWERVQRIAETVKSGKPPLVFRLKEVKVRAPILRPGKILCSGINYRSHQEENPGAKFPDEPFFFAKLPSTVIGPAEPILYPAGTKQLDYEVELAIVVGKTARAISEAEAGDHVFGYTILHDVSARDVQFRDNQITLGKNFDSFCPIGPCIVTADEIPDPGNIALRSYVNGEPRQNGSTAEWIFSVNRLLFFLSGIMTLEPGDVISTGTPAGVGLFRKPPAFLKPGDVVRLEAEGIGYLENVIA
jgi:2-keto-4-pentenoate hydratase/2-oxohepta-3-ene-1,7-dioic acid hydratase in catechol pathway